MNNFWCGAKQKKNVSMLLFLTIVLAIAFSGRLTKPIINLISASKSISSGKLDSKVPDIDMMKFVELKGRIAEAEKKVQ